MSQEKDETTSKDPYGDIVTGGFLASIALAVLSAITGESFFAGLAALCIAPFMIAVAFTILGGAVEFAGKIFK